MSPAATPELRLLRNELLSHQFAWKDRPSPGLLQTARELRKWQQSNDVSTAMCTFTVRGSREYASPFQSADVHKNPGDVDWTGSVGNLHIHEQTGATGRDLIVKDAQALVFSDELFTGIIDPSDRLFLFVKHFFYESPEGFINNLRTVPMRREMTFLEAFARAAVNPAMSVEAEEFRLEDFQIYLKRLTTDSGIKFFMGDLKSDKLAYHGQSFY